MEALEDLTTGVIIGDALGTIQYMNPAAEQALGVSRNQATGSAAADLPWLAGHDLGRLLDKSAMGEGPRVQRGIELSQGRFDCTVSRRHDGGFVAELTSVDWSLSALSAAAQAARQTAIEGLLRGLAHEVNNPLGGVRGAAQLLEQRLNDPELGEYTQLIVNEVDRLAELVKRVTQPGGNFRPAPVNVHEVCERVRVLLESDPSGDIDIVRDFDPSLPEIQGERDQLIQALLNVARNAIQADAKTLTLRTRFARRQLIGRRVHAQAIVVQVIDDGCGIDDELVEHLFYPLVSGRTNGSGIGLAQAQGAATAHGGMLECTQPRDPTVFSLWLPVSS